MVSSRSRALLSTLFAVCCITALSVVVDNDEEEAGIQKKSDKLVKITL